MKRKSNKKPPKHKSGGSWLQVFSAVLAGIGTFLAGLAEILKAAFKLTD